MSNFPHPSQRESVVVETCSRKLERTNVKPQVGENDYLRIFVLMGINIIVSFESAENGE